MREWALVSHRGGQKRIKNVITSSATRDQLESRWATKDGMETIEPLDSLPDSVKRTYRYWGERP